MDSKSKHFKRVMFLSNQLNDDKGERLSEEFIDERMEMR
jgi:hypothetical protein